MLNTEPPTAVRIVFGISPVAFLMEQVRLTIPWRHQTGNPETVSPNGDETLALSELQAPFQRAALEASGPLETVQH
ncbi:hypothetical protein OFB63_34615, partial [Escherichia coli]|nr:hypothetical protein [Escherichia coli]